MYFPMSMNITIIALSLRTFRRKTCLLNFTSGSIYFFSFGLSVRMHALNMFHMTVISKRIWGQFPFARPLSFLSFNAYHRFSPLRIFNNGIATLPRNSTLWSRSSSYTVTSRTELMSFTLLLRNNKIYSLDYIWIAQILIIFLHLIIFNFSYYLIMHVDN